ncbi:L-rhamnose mutarotase [Ruegeria atlantica]|uniref:L-rhamnose mutarotase n=1 Tax=Ruegeria atlantica TaxID=81569 RepID=UPI00147F3CA6|nr:L-rhamnose mutarotase [Ruegeria atlantica]
MTRIVLATRIRPKKRTEYVEMHFQPDPEAARALYRFHHENYRLDLVGPYAVASFDYTGADIAEDRRQMRALPELTDWMARTQACQEPLSPEDTQIWSELTPIFTTSNRAADD